MLTQERLKELLHYDPDTGVFIRLAERKNQVKVGDIAGYKQKNGYISIAVDNEKHFAHRLAFLYMNGSLPPSQVDHISHDRSDNRWVNLRLAEYIDNRRNSSKYKNNTSGITGVSWNVKLGKWTSQITVFGARKHLGCFVEFHDAIESRLYAEKKYGFHENHGL